MDLTIMGYASAILMGLSLGVFGGGGSILSVPIFVYLFKIEPTVATIYSLFVVGFTSFFGAMSSMKYGLVKFKTALLFSSPSFFSVFLVRKLLMPLIPHHLGEIGGMHFTKNLLIMILFSIIMLLAAYNMIKKKKEVTVKPEVSVSQIIINGLIVGAITGVVGAGGGFLIIPTLVLFFHLPMKEAVGTSLLIITLNSLFGFAINLNTSFHVAWDILILFTIISVIGIFAGTYISRYTNEHKLKPAFGWFVLSMGSFIIVQQLLTIQK